MLSSLLGGSTLPVLEQVVQFTEARHGVLAGNIANLDTPGYRTRDLSPELFQEKLQEAVESLRSGRDSDYRPYDAATYVPGGMTEKSLDPFREVEDSIKSILYHDDSDVSMEQQVNELVKNQQQHNLAISIMTAQMRLLRAAITERVA